MIGRAGAASLASGLAAALLLHLDEIGRPAESVPNGPGADLAHWTAEAAVFVLVGGSVFALIRARSRRQEAGG